MLMLVKNLAYATGPFLDGIVQSCASRIEQALGAPGKSVYHIPRDKLAASRRRFESLVQDASQRLRRLAASTLSHTIQKRPAAEDSESERYVIRSWRFNGINEHCV